MAAIRNVAKERLEAGELAIGVGLRQARTVDIAKIMKTAGYDYLFIDCEHSSMSVDLAGQISTAAQDAGITPIVRVPGFQHFHASRALDAGAQGIVVPHVDTEAEARRIVDAFRYPPAGTRSWGGGQAMYGYKQPGNAQAQAELNDEILIIGMIEAGLVATGLTGAWVRTVQGLVFLAAVVFYLLVEEPQRRASLLRRLRLR